MTYNDLPAWRISATAEEIGDLRRRGWADGFRPAILVSLDDLHRAGTVEKIGSGRGVR